MGRLEIAAERLTKALNALDAAVAPLQGAKADAADARARLAALDAERETLLVRIAELEEDARALGDVSEDVEDRLDGAIGEIRAALGR